MSLLPSGSAVAIAARGSIAAPTRRLLTRSIVDHVGGRCERRAHRGFVAARPAKADVAGRGLVQLRRVRRLRGARVGDGGKRLVIDLDALGGVGGLRQRLGDHRHDRLAAMAHGAARQREARRLRHRRAVARAHRPQRPHRRHAVRRHVGAGEHRDHAGQWPSPPTVSIRRMRACACGERTSTQASAPGSSMSATKRPRPSRKRRSSTRRSGAPMPW